MKTEGFSDNEIVGFVDSFPRKQQFMGYKVYKSEEVSQLEYDYLVVCVKKTVTILKTCIAEKLDLKRIFLPEKKIQSSC